MTHTLIECGACGWRSADHPTATDAANAGVAHLAQAHPNMASPAAGREQLRLFAYLTLGEYLGAHGAEPSEEAESEEEEEGAGEGEEEGEEEEGSIIKPASPRPPRRPGKPTAEEEKPRPRGREPKPRRK